MTTDDRVRRPGPGDRTVPARLHRHGRRDHGHHVLVATGTGPCQGRPEWADLVCSTGPAGAITGGGSNPASCPITTTEYDWWARPAKVTETANGVDPHHHQHLRRRRPSD